MHLLTKSKYIVGLQCPKFIWTTFHEPDKVKEPDLNAQYRFDQGNLVGELAKKLFPEGINISTENFNENLKKTKELLKSNMPLFEAGIIFENCFARIDILLPIKNNEYDILEVKSGTKVKEENLHDVSFQKYCCENSGLKIRNCYLIHINNEYVKNGEINPNQILIKEDVTNEVNELIKDIQERIGSIFEIINSRECPDISKNPIKEGSHDCFQEGCMDFLPEDNIFTLYSGGKKAFELYDKGITTIKQIPKDYKLLANQQIQRDCEISGKTYINKERIKHFLKTLYYPLYYLDFETFNPAIPFYDGMKPYQKVPFQFSLHVVRKEGEEPEHYSFLAKNKEDPRKELLSELKKVLGETGSIISYNQAFEMGILKELANNFPEYKNWIENMLVRVVDLLTPFRNFHYYNPIQHGSASIKEVLPAITGDGYKDLDISDGGTASIKFLEATFNEIPEEERIKIREDLEKYCGLDTEGMIWIVEKLKRLIE